jgi:hypothetical protein
MIIVYSALNYTARRYTELKAIAILVLCEHQLVRKFSG